MGRDIISLELAQALKEAGAPQESYFVWYTYRWDRDDPECRHALLRRGDLPMSDRLRTVAAFTLGEMIQALGKDFGVLDHFDSGNWGAYIPHDCGVNGIGDTPVEAVGRLWLAVLQGATEHGA